MTTRHKNPQYNLRMPDDLKEKLKSEADRRGVSLNAEIILRLEQSLYASSPDLPELPSADKLQQASNYSLEQVRAAAWREVTDEIVRAAQFGHKSQLLTGPALDLEDEDHKKVFDEISTGLVEKGYDVREVQGHLYVRWGGTE